MADGVALAAIQGLNAKLESTGARDRRPAPHGGNPGRADVVGKHRHRGAIRCRVLSLGLNRGDVMIRKLLLVPLLMMGCLGGADYARAQFCPGVSPWVFDDVLASDPFCGFITKIANQGVTLGCLVIDGNHRLFCPGDAVRRDQMAAPRAPVGRAVPVDVRERPGPEVERVRRGRARTTLAAAPGRSRA